MTVSFDEGSAINGKYTGVDAGILKRGELRISDNGGPTMVGGDVPEIFKN